MTGDKLVQLIKTKKQQVKNFSNYCDFFHKSREMGIGNFIWTRTL